MRRGKYLGFGQRVQEQCPDTWCPTCKTGQCPGHQLLRVLFAYLTLQAREARKPEIPPLVASLVVEWSEHGARAVLQ